MLTTYTYKHIRLLTRVYGILMWVAHTAQGGGRKYLITTSPLHIQGGQTALYVASDNGHDQVVELLLRREADVNHQTKVRLLLIECNDWSSSCYFTGVFNHYFK